MLRKQMLISFFSVFFIALTGLVTIPILTRLLSSEDIGKLFFILTLIGLMQIFEGLRPVITFMINSKEYPEKLIIKIINKINYFFIFIISIIIFIGEFFFTTFSPLEIIYFIMAFIVYMLASVQWGILDTKNNVHYTALIRTIGWIFTYLLFVIFAYFKISSSLYIIPLLLMNIIIYVSFRLKVLSIKNEEKDERIDKNERDKLVKKIFFQILDNIKIQLAASILLSMDKIITPMIVGYQQFSFYAVQSDLSSKGYIINATWKRVLFPKLARKKNDLELKLFLIYGIYAFILIFCLFVIINNYGNEIIGFYAGKSYCNYGFILSVLIFIFPLNILGTMGVLLLQIHGDFKTHYSIYSRAAAINLIIFTILTYLFGIKGATIGLLVSRTVDIYIFIIALNKYLISIPLIIANKIVILYLSIVILLMLHKVFLACLLSFLMFISLFKILRRINNL